MYALSGSLCSPYWQYRSGGVRIEYGYYLHGYRPGLLWFYSGSYAVLHDVRAYEGQEGCPDKRRCTKP